MYCQSYLIVLWIAVIAYALSKDSAPASSATTETAHVSWQSVFLGLVSLALNSMTQASILDHTFPQSSLLFPFRSSPFICVADALDVIIDFAIHLHNRTSLQEAACLIQWRRARLRLGDDLTEIERSPSEQHPKTYAILQMATILQAIKIWGLGGFVWAKVWAAMYLSSFLVLWAVDGLCPQERRGMPPPWDPARESMNNSFAYVLILLAGFGHLILWDWTLYHLLGLESVDQEPSWALEFLLIYGHTFVLFPLMEGPLESAFESIDEYRGRPPDSFMLNMEGIIFIITLVAGILSRWIIRSLDMEAFRATAILIIGGGVIWATISIEFAFWNDAYPEMRLAKDDNVELWYHFLSILFAGFNFLLAFLYYRFRYSGEGTIKPAWTENLG